MTSPTPLGIALADLDAAISKHGPDVFDKLRAGVTTAELDVLSASVGPLPKELVEWFAWHDGQDGTGNIGPSGNDYLLSVAGMAADRQFLSEEGNPPFEPDWLPLMANGGGDYVVYDRAEGRLLRYFHDDDARPVVAASLTAWAIELAAAWRAVARVPAEPEGWSLVPDGSITATECSPGTALYFRTTVATFGPGVFCAVFWKKAPNQWFTATQGSLEQCWATIAANLFPFRALSDARAAAQFAPAKVFADGKDAPHAGLHRAHFPDVPNAPG
jgi:cell wall assembly regulator SMI1